MIFQVLVRHMTRFSHKRSFRVVAPTPNGRDITIPLGLIPTQRPGVTWDEPQNPKVCKTQCNVSESQSHVTVLWVSFVP